MLAAALLLAAVVQENVASRADPTQTYTLVLPGSYDPAKKHPLLFVFDPRARGNLGAEIFREAADEHGWILISSNNTMSDGPWEPNEKAIRALYPEVERYAADPKRLYAAGFSGTAAVSWSFGIRSRGLAGVIGVGGRHLDGVPPRDFNFAHYGFAGETDFNNREMREIDALLTVPHRFEQFAGGHRWITPALARDALRWFEVMAMKDGRRTRDEAFLANAYALDAAAAAAAPPREALRRYQAIVRTFDGLVPVDDARAAVARLEKDAGVRRELEAEARWDAFEARFIRDTLQSLGTLVAQLRSENAPDIKGTLMREFRIVELERRAKREGAEGRTARRLLALVRSQMAFHLPALFEAKGDKAFAAACRAVAEEMKRQ